ncbi:PREDICTED: uncharacterized protein LOC108375589, partial [Rhagoletis zephyria]|uniref:uncharacterized protein LOC108375589 n=1 Tax=Rhagoletis zephyria TaxID=28612 RepID=UPI000811A6F9
MCQKVHNYKILKFYFKKRGSETQAAKQICKVHGETQLYFSRSRFGNLFVKYAPRIDGPIRETDRIVKPVKDVNICSDSQAAILVSDREDIAGNCRADELERQDTFEKFYCIKSM